MRTVAMNAKMQEISLEVIKASRLEPYQAVNALWVSLVKLANLLPITKSEHEQIASLLRGLTREQATRVLADPGVDQLLKLNPPLETILADRRERLSPQRAASELARLREQRVRDPKRALAALFEILQRIRDKREHGFKTPSGSRDAEILGAACSILESLCGAAVKHIEAAVLSSP